MFGTEFAIEAYRLLMEVLGANAVVRSGSPGAVLAGRIERMHRSALILTFGGGTNEVQRDIIAAAGLGLPVSDACGRELRMDFGFTEEQAELAGLTRKILADRTRRRRRVGRLWPRRACSPAGLPACAAAAARPRPARAVLRC